MYRSRKRKTDEKTYIVHFHFLFVAIDHTQSHANWFFYDQPEYDEFVVFHANKCILKVTSLLRFRILLYRIIWMLFTANTNKNTNTESNTINKYSNGVYANLIYSHKIRLKVQKLAHF